MVPQLDGPRSLPMRESARGWMDGFSRQVERDSSQGGTYMLTLPSSIINESLLLFNLVVL